MKILQHTTTERLQPDTLAKGETVNDLIPELSDELATELAVHPDAKVTLTGGLLFQAREDVPANDISLEEILAAVHSGCTSISLEIPGDLAFGGDWTETYSISNITEDE